ncbi:MAG: hypothetical protein ACRDQ0_06770, partial [Pseudonocardia sp.]
LVSALVLMVRRSGDSTRARLLGIGSCDLIVGVVGHVWLDLFAAMRNAGVLARFGQNAVAEPGVGAWLLLIAGVVALAPIALLLVPARGQVAPDRRTIGIRGRYRSWSRRRVR